jgi:hypothetical protein
MRWLESEHADLVPPPKRRFKDELSRNSIQNFQQLGRYLADLPSPPCRRIRLTIVSSDYHVARLRFVDEHLPPQSLVHSVASAIHPELPDWECAPFSPPPDAADAIRWCADVYTQAEQLMPMQINIEGVLHPRLNGISEVVYSRFRTSVSALEKLVDSPPEQVRTRFRTTLDTAGQHVRSMAELPDRLAPHVDVVGNPMHELEDVYKIMRGALRDLRNATDLDAPEFDRLYQAQ